MPLDSIRSCAVLKVGIAEAVTIRGGQVLFSSDEICAVVRIDGLRKTSPGAKPHESAQKG